MGTEDTLAKSLNDAEVAQFQEHGYLRLREPRLTSGEIATVRQALRALGPPAHVVREEGEKGAIRSIYDAHRASPVIRRVCGHPRLIDAAEQLLGGPVYYFQVKVNFKSALSCGGVWPWHSDYLVWQEEDQLPTPDIMTMAIHLDSATDHNGALLVAPGSHLEPIATTETDGLRYPLRQTDTDRVLRRTGIRTLTASAGSVVVFDSRLLHASGPNMAPVDRTVILVRFSRMDNVPRSPRPEWLANPEPVQAKPVTV